LNYLERRNGRFLRYFTEFGAFDLWRIIVFWCYMSPLWWINCIIAVITD